MTTQFTCPKCQLAYFNFKELCVHVQHDHGLWYLSKDALDRKTAYRSRCTSSQNCQKPTYCQKTMTELGEIKHHLEVEIGNLKQQNQNLLSEFRILKSLPVATGESISFSNRYREETLNQTSSPPVDYHRHYTRGTSINNSEQIKDLKDSVKSEVHFLNQSYENLRRELNSLKLSLYTAEKDDKKSSQTGSVLADSGKGGSLVLSEEIAPINDVLPTPFQSPVKFPYPVKTGFLQRLSSPSSSRECSASSQGSLRKAKPFRNKNAVTSTNTIPEGEEDDCCRDAVFPLVFHYLKTGDLLVCRNVCRRWRRWLANPNYWISFTLTHCRVTSDILTDVASCCTKMRFLTLQGLKCADNSSRNMIKNSNCGRLELGLESLLKSSQHSLQSVSIIDCGNLLTERSLWLIGCYCPQIRQLAYISDCYPVTAEALWSLGAGCRKLCTLIIPPLHPCLNPKRFNDRCLLMVGKCWHFMRTLCIGGTEITAAGLIDLVASCHLLEALELDHMGEIHESVAKRLCEEGLDELQQIYLTHTPITPNAVLLLSEKCPKLEKISILIAPGDYFLHPERESNKEKFDRRVEALKLLKKHRSLRNALVIEVTGS